VVCCGTCAHGIGSGDGRSAQFFERAPAIDTYRDGDLHAGRTTEDTVMDIDFPLVSDGPHASLEGVDRLFEPFIGSWDLRVTWHEDDVIVRTMDGEWHFAWVLEGRAIQDIWIVPRRDQRRSNETLYEYGMSIRFPDFHGGWSSTWIGPMRQLVHTFTASRVGDDVVLITHLDDGRRMRWAFTEITADSFLWSNATEADGTWIVTQRFEARRTPTPAR
jgi:hypothetical protein